MNPFDLIPLMCRGRDIVDAFNRTLAANNGDGWGTADTGQPYIGLQQKSLQYVDPALGASVAAGVSRSIGVVNAGVTDVNLEITFSGMSGTTAGNQGMVARALDVQNYVLLSVGTTATRIVTRIAGSYVTRATVASTIDMAKDVLSAQVVGDTYTVFKNGDPFVYWTDNAGPNKIPMFTYSTLFGFELMSTAAHVRRFRVVPLAFAAPKNRDPSFQDQYQQDSIANYTVFFHKETASFTTDPLKPGGQRVLRVDVPNTALGPSVNPRVQMSTSPVLSADTHVFAGFAMMFPSGTGPTAGATPFPRMPEGFTGFMNFTQFYTQNPESSPPFKLGMRAGSGRELMWQRNGTYGGDRPWRLGKDVTLDMVYEFIVEEVFSNDPTVGYVRLWMRTSKAEGWVRQKFFAGTPEETDTLWMKTMDAAANINDPNRHDMQVYRSVDMFDMVTMFFYGHRVGKTFDQVDTRYYALAA